MEESRGGRVGEGEIEGPDHRSIANDSSAYSDS